MIVSNKWIRSSYGKKLVIILLAKVGIVEIIDFGELPVFENAATFPVIIITRKGKFEKQNFVYAPIKRRLDFESLTNEIIDIGSVLDEHALRSENWALNENKATKYF